MKALPSGASSWRAPALLALWLLATPGLRPLLVPDEGRYASVARDMLASGDWLVPRLDGLPFFHKPPLFYWLDAIAMGVLGENQWSARFASAVGAWIMGTAAWFVLRRWHGEAVARVALVVLATTPFFFIGAQYANHDMLVAGLISAAVLAFAEGSRGGSRRAWQLGWIACALALLAKGLIGLVLPLGIVGPWLLARGQWRSVLRGLHPWHWLPGLVVAAPWFVAMQLRYPDFFDYFIVEQHFRRFTQTSFNNAQPWWFFLAVLPLLALPWSAAWPKALRERGSWPALYAWWVVVVVGFFSLPTSKLVGYVMPALLPCCALAALAFDADGQAWRRMAAVAAAVCLAIVGVLAWKAPHSSKPAALALAAQRLPGEPVVFVDEMVYDLLFYARLERPAIVASDWSNPKVAMVDNWRKELADAARFDRETARQVLWPLGRLPELLCRPGGGHVWFVGPSDAPPPAVPGLETVQADRETTLGRARARDCRP